MLSIPSDLGGALWACLVIAAATSTISVTVTQTEIFAGIRRLAARLHPQIGHLFRCFYCFSHWVALAGVLVYRPILLGSGIIAIDLVVSWFVTVALAALFSGAIFVVFLAAIAKHTREHDAQRHLGAGNGS